MLFEFSADFPWSWLSECFVQPLRVFNNFRSFVFGLFWPLFPQPLFVFNNFLALFLKKRILFLPFALPEGGEARLPPAVERLRPCFSVHASFLSLPAAPARKLRK